MATFSNYATLSYTGGSTNSNTVTGEILEVLSAVKTAVKTNYTANGSVTYVISLINSGNTALTGVTVTDNMGGYTFGTETVYPLKYTTGSVRYYINGVLQSAPTVVAGPPMVISGLTVPANGNAIIVYETEITNYAPLGETATVNNTATVSANEISAPLTVSETVQNANRSNLAVSKAVSPETVTENGNLTYTFVISNFGNEATQISDNVVLSDTFNPILKSIAVSFNGNTLVQNTDYNYNISTGVFNTVGGVISVPAASYTQNSDGTWTVTPGTSTLVISGTV